MDSSADHDPYDDYALVSGFYGPGTMMAWYLMVASVIVTWSNNLDHRFRISGDFLAAFFYPMIAGGHVLIQIAQFPIHANNGRYLVNNLIHLVSPQSKGPVVSSMTILGNEPIFDEGSKERRSLHARVVAIGISLRILEMSSMLALFGLLAILVAGDGRRSRYMAWIFCTNLVWTWTVEMTLLLRTIKHGGGQLIVSTPLDWFLGVFTFLMLFSIVIGISRGFLNVILFVRGPIVITLRALLGSVQTWLGMALVSWMIYCLCPKGLFLPKTGISITELDQAAALVGGLVTLCYSLYAVDMKTWWKNTEEAFHADDHKAAAEQDQTEAIELQAVRAQSIRSPRTTRKLIQKLRRRMRWAEKYHYLREKRKRRTMETQERRYVAS